MDSRELRKRKEINYCVSRKKEATCGLMDTSNENLHLNLSLGEDDEKKDDEEEEYCKNWLYSMRY